MKYLVTVLAITMLAVGQIGFAQDMNDHDTHKKMEAPTSKPSSEKVQTRLGDPWPLDTCVVSGEKLGSMGDPIVYLHEGREVRFCCKGCVDMFKSDPEKHLSKADKKIKEEQVDIYPVEYDIVDPETKLPADHSEAHAVVVGNRLFLLANEANAAKLKKNPEKYIAKLDAAVVEAQSADYPLETCVVSGEKLGSMGETINYVYNGQLVKFCCKGCVKGFEKDPQKYMSKLETAEKGMMKMDAHEMHEMHDSDDDTMSDEDGHEMHNH